MEGYTNAYPKQGFLFKRNPSYSEMPNRRIVSNRPDEAVCSNEIKTSKYTLIDFIPRNLIVQFSKLPNIYFLVIGIMQMINQISASGGFPAIYLPLAIVVAVSGFKDFYEDLKRKQSDLQINSQQTERLKEQGYIKQQWKDLLIGNIVRVRKNEQFPADVILLQSSEERMNCFIETKNLDGETNLKMKQIKNELGKELVQCSVSELYSKRLQFKYERPNPFIYNFTGSWNGIVLDNSNVVLRGCSLRITDYVVGLVIYTGDDTKIMLNSNKTRQKKSRLEFKMGILVIIVFILQLLITFSCALIATFSHSPPYIPVLDGRVKTLFLRWGGWILLFTNFVPISLIVSLEMVKYIQGNMIAGAAFNTSAPASVVVQTSTLNEELGQIQHLFTDKTGTLTKNYMSFKYMALPSSAYGYDVHRSVIPPQITNVDFHDVQFMSMRKEDNSEVYSMLECLAFCHNVIVEQSEEMRFNASSPDELAFINMAKYCGWLYTGINKDNEMCIRTTRGDIRYKLLHTIEFTSDRKRMAVILECRSRIFVLIKGADNVMMSRMKSTSECDYVKGKVNEWSKKGLRTLVFGRREIQRKQYDKWARMYAVALSRLDEHKKEDNQRLKQQLTLRSNVRKTHQGELLSLTSVTKIIIEDTQEEQLLKQAPQIVMNRLLNDNLSEYQKQFIDKYFDKMEPNHNCSVEELQSMLEKELDLVGATAIEDQLQDNVYESICLLRECGVKVWMLTGDKKETAVDIGYSCGLISADMAVIYWQGAVEDTLAEIEKYPVGRECCLVATGEDLLSQMTESVLLRVVGLSRAIICCRVSPKQKQDMVWLMRKNKYTTLAVGDGANDVNMINTAHVGVGIKGVEGAQAALCSDYAISEFQILTELMLYHGRQSYRKNAQLIMFTFYKNILLSFPQFWYGLNNQFSSAPIYDPLIYQLYNVLFTSLPIVIFAVFDQQYSRDYSLKNPKLYESGLTNRLFSPIVIFSNLIVIPIYALVICLISVNSLGRDVLSSGVMFELLGIGMNMYAQVVIIANLKVLVISYSRSIGLYLSILFGVISFYITSQGIGLILSKGSLYPVINLEVQTLTAWITTLASVLLVYLMQTIICELGRLKESLSFKQIVFEEIQLKEIMNKQ